MHLDIFRQAEKLGLKKVFSYPKRRPRPALPKATGFPVHSVSSARPNTTLFIYLFYKGGPFSITRAPHSVILEWSVLQKGMNYSFLKKTDCFTVAGTKKDALHYCTGNKTMTWATLTAEHFLRWHLQDNSFAFCCSVPNFINDGTPIGWVTQKVSVALLLVICLIKGM